MPNKKNLLILTSSYPSSIHDGRAAAGFFVKDFASELSKKHNITVVTQDTGEESDRFKSDGYPVLRFSWLGKDRPLYTLRLPRDFFLIISILTAGMFACFRQINKHDVDHIIALWAIPCGLWALAVKLVYKTPYTIWCLGADIWNYQNSRIMKSLLRLILKNASVVYADGFELCETIKDIAQVDCNFLPSSRILTPSKDNYVLKPERSRHYLFVGRYHYNKGPDILIRAIHALPKDTRVNSHFHFFGGGPLVDELKKLIQELELGDFITLGGFIGEEELTKVLQAADAVIIPSRKDSIPLMLSAALQMNKPIIATDVGDTGYMLKKFNAGRVVPIETAESSLAYAITEDISTQDTYGTGRSTLLKEFDLSTSVENMLDKIVNAG